MTEHFINVQHLPIRVHWWLHCEIDVQQLRINYPADWLGTTVRAVYRHIGRRYRKSYLYLAGVCVPTRTI